LLLKVAKKKDIKLKDRTDGESYPSSPRLSKKGFKMSDSYRDNNTQISINQIFAEWLDNYRWDWWATLTFRFVVKDTIKTKQYYRNWIQKDVQPFVSEKIGYFLAVERFGDGINTHIHSVIRVGKETNGENIYIYPFWRKWFERYGRARIEVYDERKGGNYYLSKYISKEICDWDIESPESIKNLTRGKFHII